MKCFERRGTEEVPGCRGVGFYGIDYCYEEVNIAPVIATPQTQPPTARPTEPPVTGEFHCGCHTCTSDAYNADASGHTCGARMQWLVDYGYAANQIEACEKVSDEFPSICGLKCHPSKCNNARTPSSPDNPSCDSICLGSYPSTSYGACAAGVCLLACPLCCCCSLDRFP